MVRFKDKYNSIKSHKKKYQTRLSKDDKNKRNCYPPKDMGNPVERFCTYIEVLRTKNDERVVILKAC